MSKKRTKKVGLAYLVIGAMIGGGLISLSMISRPIERATVEHVVKATVQLTDEHGGGSGVVIGPHTILTAEHVVDGEKEMTVTLSNGQKMQGTVTFADEVHDLAFVQVDKPLPAPLRISHGKPKVGDRVVVVGSPLLVFEAATFGQVASTEAVTLQDTPPLLALNVTVAPGNSGGAVVDLETGELIGVTDAVMVVPLGFSGSIIPITFAVPTATLVELLPAF